MHDKNKKYASKRFILAGSVAVGCFAFFTAAYALGYHVNITKSYPLGIYQKVMTSEYQRGDLVIFCPPKREVFAYALQQGWLVPGSCPSATISMMKKIAGIEGDTILIDKFVYINGIKQPNSLVQNIPYKARSAQLQKNEVLLLSDYSSMSFDGRYFGAITKNHILGKVTPVYTW